MLSRGFNVFALAKETDRQTNRDRETETERTGTRKLYFSRIVV